MDECIVYTGLFHWGSVWQPDTLWSRWLLSSDPFISFFPGPCRSHFLPMWPLVHSGSLCWPALPILILTIGRWKISKRGEKITHSPFRPPSKCLPFGGPPTLVEVTLAWWDIWGVRRVSHSPGKWARDTGHPQNSVERGLVPTTQDFVPKKKRPQPQFLNMRVPVAAAWGSSSWNFIAEFKLDRVQITDFLKIVAGG